MPGVPLCTLRTYQPTPTTVRFTVSTRAAPEQFVGRLAHYLLLAGRLVLGTIILLILWMKWQNLLQHSWHLPSGLAQSGPGSTMKWIAEQVPARYLVPVALLFLWIIVQRGYKEESLLVLRGLGIQTTSSASTYLSTASTRFIPTTVIQDILIHEAFKGFEVRFYLAIVVEGEEDLVVVFPNLLPSLSILEQVWRGARSCLYEQKA